MLTLAVVALVWALGFWSGMAYTSRKVYDRMIRGMGEFPGGASPEAQAAYLLAQGEVAEVVVRPPALLRKVRIVGKPSGD